MTKKRLKIGKLRESRNKKDVKNIIVSLRLNEGYHSKLLAIHKVLGIDTVNDTLLEIIEAAFISCLKQSPTKAKRALSAYQPPEKRFK